MTQQRIWLKAQPTDSDNPADLQFIAVRKGGEVLTGTVHDIDEDMFNANWYGEPDYDVAEVWMWAESGPVQLTVQIQATPYDANGFAMRTLELLAPDATVVASTSRRIDGNS